MVERGSVRFGGLRVTNMERSVRDQLREYAALTRRGSEVFWSLVKRWFLVAILVGLFVGLTVTVFERAVYVTWGYLLPRLTPVTVVLAPTLGLLLSGLCLQYLTVNPEIHGTEEYIRAYHERGGVVRFRSFPGKMLAAFSTLAFGGSAGLEGPSIYAGSAIGSYLLRRMRRIGFTADDVRVLMVAGAAAGVSAVFKAPLTGIVFALEVPYRDDLARHALVPAMVSSVTSYLVLVQFLGVAPLFDVGGRYAPAPVDLALALALGLVIGLAGRLFVVSFEVFGRLMRRLPVPLWARTGLGGLVTGLFGLLSLSVLGQPAALGTGYESVGKLLGGQWAGWQALELLVLKAGAVLATLTSGAAGGIFIPLIVLGASLGAALGGFVPGAGGALFPIVGMAAFLAAGYNTPIAATVFIAETTGGAGFIIPGLVAAAVAYVTAGRVSVSDQQRWRRESTLDQIMRARVGDIMTRDVVTVRSDETVKGFVTRKVPQHRHKSMPVVDDDGRLAGMIALTDVQSLPSERWADVPLAELMRTDVLTAVPGTLVGELSRRMVERDIDRVPVVDPADPGRIVGIISDSDILGLERMTSGTRPD